MARKPKRNVKRLRVYEKALEYVDLEGGETVIDAYCGTGTISLCLAKKAKRVIGIEIVKPAIEDAKKNAKKNHMENTEFYATDAGKFMPQLYRKGLIPDVIVMDPVRVGCSKEVLKAAAGMNPKRIVYVSCNLATLSKMNLKSLSVRDYLQTSGDRDSIQDLLLRPSGHFIAEDTIKKSKIIE